jgi:exodeoxyribonuclease X
VTRSDPVGHGVASVFDASHLKNATMKFRVVDIETAGGDPSEILEIAAVDVVKVGERWSAGPPRAKLFRPSGPISFHTMAIHHITPADIPAGAEPCSPNLLSEFLGADRDIDCLVAHNADFERRHIRDGAPPNIPWLCTVKAARAIWPGAPGYSNQVLRYWRGLELDPRLALPPHRAGPDAWVTAHLLIDLLRECSPADLLRRQYDAAPSKTVSFGRHRGRAWSDVPADYLDWILSRQDMDSAVVERSKAELADRAAAKLIDAGETIHES